MMQDYTRIRPAFVTGPCPNNQTLCERIADGRNGDALSDCPLCNPYAIGKYPAHYPVPAIRYRTFESLRNLGYVSALNNFDVDTVFEYYIKD